jgi:hypothetical protein
MTTAIAQIPVTHFELEQCESFEFSVVEWPGDRYTWDLYTELEWETVNFARQDGNVDRVPYFEKGMYEGSTVTLNWIDPGRYFLRVMIWDEVTCTNNLLVFSINVNESKPTATIEGSEACYGEPSVFKIILTGLGPWDISYVYGDEENVAYLNGIVEPEQIITLPGLAESSFDVWVKEIIDQCSSNLEPSEKGRVVIFPKPSNSKIYHADN